MAATVTENDNLPIGQFTPFNDTDKPRIQQAIQIIDAVQGYDTTQIDRFRQGVNVRLPQHLYKTTQPKIWSGRFDHQTKVITFGQARSFVEYDDSTIFREKPEFNPVWFIEDRENYPYPIIFNDGPQQEEEASIEPFTIPMRKNNNEGPFYPRSIKASLEDGNGFDDLFGGTTRVEQFIDYSPPLDPRFFLDEGQEYWGGSVANSIIVEGFTPIIIRNLDPFDDTRDERIAERLQTTDQEFISAVKALDFDLSEDIRGTFARKSATAGGEVYGPDAAIYGTDSIAFRGLIRGA